MKNKQVIMVIAAALVVAAGIGFGAAKLTNNKETTTETSVSTEQSAAPSTHSEETSATAGATAATADTTSPNATTSNPTTTEGAQPASESEEAVITTTPASPNGANHTAQPNGVQQAANSVSNNATSPTAPAPSAGTQQTGTTQPTGNAQTSGAQPGVVKVTDAAGAPYSVGIFTGYADICDHLNLAKQDPSTVANGKSVCYDYSYGGNTLVLAFDKTASGNLELREFQVNGNAFTMEDGISCGDNLDTVRGKYEPILGKSDIKHYNDGSAELIFKKDNLKYVLYFTKDSKTLVFNSYRVTRVDLDKK